MPVVEVSLPMDVDAEIDRLVEQDEFVNRDQAIEALLAEGISAYDWGGESSTEMEEDLFTQAVSDQQDPAMDDDA